MFHPIMLIFQSFHSLCTSVIGTHPDLGGQLYSARVEAPLLSWGLMRTGSTILLLGMKLLPATTLFSMGRTVMAPTNKYLVMKSLYEGEYVRADSVEETDNTVSFMRGDETIKAFLKSEILSYGLVTE